MNLQLFGLTNVDQIHMDKEPKLTSPASAQEAVVNATTQTASYVQADVQSIVALANDLKAKYNTLQTQVAEIVTKLNGMFS